MAGMVQTDLGPSTAAKYKEEPVGDPVSKFSFPMALFHPRTTQLYWHDRRNKQFFPECRSRSLQHHRLSHLPLALACAGTIVFWRNNALSIDWSLRHHCFLSLFASISTLTICEFPSPGLVPWGSSMCRVSDLVPSTEEILASLSVFALTSVVELGHG